jgi:hypothetical protein
MPRRDRALADPLAYLRQSWEVDLTLKILRAIANARQVRGQSIDSMQEAHTHWRPPHHASHPAADRLVAIAPSKSSFYRYLPIYLWRFMKRIAS